MPTFPSASAPAGPSTHRQPDPAAKQHIAEYVDAAYAAAGLPRPRRASEGAGRGAAGYGQTYAGQATTADRLPETLYQRYDDTRERLEPPAKRPRPSRGY